MTTRNFFFETNSIESWQLYTRHIISAKYRASRAKRALRGSSDGGWRKLHGYCNYRSNSRCGHKRGVAYWSVVQRTTPTWHEGVGRDDGAIIEKGGDITPCQPWGMSRGGDRRSLPHFAKLWLLMIWRFPLVVWLYGRIALFFNEIAIFCKIIFKSKMCLYRPILLVFMYFNLKFLWIF